MYGKGMTLFFLLKADRFNVLMYRDILFFFVHLKQLSKVLLGIVDVIEIDAFKSMASFDPLFVDTR